MKPQKPKLFLLWTERAIKVRESCDTPWNNAWINCQHGSLDFKLADAPHLERYLIGEIRDFGLDVTLLPHWQSSVNGRTRHDAGRGYEGSLDLQSTAAAIQFLGRYFTLIKCGEWPSKA